MYSNDFTLNKVNRRGIWISPKAPFLDWLASIYQNEKESEPPARLYLLPRIMSKANIREFLSTHFDTIFRLECKNWASDPNLWPHNRNFDLFCDWFSWHIADEIFDVVNIDTYSSRR